MTEEKGDKTIFRKIVLLIDATIGVALGGFLIGYPTSLVAQWGLPKVNDAFFPSVLGAVLIGVAIALIYEAVRGECDEPGLGIIGAVFVNSCGAVILMCWLFSGRLTVPIHGYLLIWFLTLILVLITGIEAIIFSGKSKDENSKKK